MAGRSGLYPPIFRIDVDSALAFFGQDVSIAELPQKIVDLYNASKGVVTYVVQGDVEFDGCRLVVFRNAVSQLRQSFWVSFYESSGIAISDALERFNHFVGFVVVDSEIFVHTGGHSAVVFERFVDISFPIEIARRIAEAEVKRARSSQIAGAALVSDVNFRDPRRITYRESLQNVWTALGGQVRPDVLAQPSLRNVFGNKAKMRLDVSSAIKFGPRVESLDKLIELIRWLADVAESPLPSDDEWAILDSIRVLNPRKSKDLITRLNRQLAVKLIVDRDFSNVALMNADASLYANADQYTVTSGQNEIYEGESRPEMSDVLRGVSFEAGVPESMLKSIIIRSQCIDYGTEVGTAGTLLEHIHGEIRFENHTYFVLAGRWYRVDANYIDLVTKDFVEVTEDLDLSAAEVGLKQWSVAKKEGEYNDDLPNGEIIVNGDRVFTDNVELFDTLNYRDGRTYIIHVKRGFDVKVRDVRSQIINAANIIENDLRLSEPIRLRRHHAALVRRGRTSLSEAEFLDLFEHPRTYVLAYGTETKVDKSTLDQFESMVARMEIVTLNGQFRQIVSAGRDAELRISWIEIVS
ncbi:DUF6119 family protein [Lentzea sp. NPDC058436]|uniref:DUF6119 family protein n=1 Tax=Lentzea sp. NPDC058436 TaxID=3346499 RepID=UPI003648C7E5